MKWILYPILKVKLFGYRPLAVYSNEIFNGDSGQMMKTTIVRRPPEIRSLVFTTATEAVEGSSIAQNTPEEPCHVQGGLPVCENVIIFPAIVTDAVASNSGDSSKH
ncbi:hypothetical protein AVEN_109985-1 [Araneus ventricosus]|uniref:Uncharacterized protein n=1 Tax=Araneus ventricosus TaxID=182803 RepID=A0A4Y2VTZ5_ARAVE|nr:hypothetical protein AVEN_109985-1 [Araneus ventricosus]